MATEDSAVTGTNGATGPADAPSPTSAPPPPPGAAREARRAASRAAFAAANTDETEAASSEEKPAVEPTPAPSESPESAPEDDDDDDAADETPAEDEPAVAAKPDPERDRRLAAIQKAQKRAREESIARDRDYEARVKQFEAEWSPKVAAYQEFESLKARIKYDAPSVLKALGLTEDDFERHAHQVYLNSKKAAEDPKNRASAEQLAWQREQQARLDAIEKENRELKASLQQREAAAAAKVYADQYMSKVEKAVSDETPLVKTMFAKAPEKARQRLGQLAYDLAAETDEEPTPADVVREFEKIRRAELEELGIEVPKAAPKAKAAPTEEKALAAKAETPKPNGAAKMTKEQRREATIRALEQGGSQ